MHLFSIRIANYIKKLTYTDVPARLALSKRGGSSFFENLLRLKIEADMKSIEKIH